MVEALIAAIACVVVMLWQDGENPCADGNRYTSGKRQPSPFHRRFCSWPKRLLQACSLVSLVALGALMGSWKGAVLLLTLPGAWFLSTHLTCVDAPAMALALGGSLLFKEHPWVAVFMSCVAGFLHERGPVFAALYAWHPLPLIGLVCVGWWRKPAPRRSTDSERVGLDTLRGSIEAHRPYVDFLDWRVNVFGMRSVLPLAAWNGAPMSAWTALAVANASRIVGTDGCRFLFWGAPLLIRSMGDVPLWVVALHVVSFRRLI